MFHVDNVPHWLVLGSIVFVFPRQYNRQRHVSNVRVINLWFNLCNHTPIHSWSISMDNLCNSSGDRVSRKLLLLAWQATIYTIWTERNDRLHRNSFKSVDLLLKQIDLLIRNRASSFRVSNPSLASDLLQLWFSRQVLSISKESQSFICFYSMAIHTICNTLSLSLTKEKSVGMMEIF